MDIYLLFGPNIKISLFWICGRNEIQIVPKQFVAVTSQLAP